MTPNLGYSKSENKTSPKACSSQALPSPIAYSCFLNKFYLIFQSTELRKAATKSCITSAKAAPGFVPAKAQFSLLFLRSFEQTEVLPFLSSMADCVQFRPNQRYLKSRSCQQAVFMEPSNWAAVENSCFPCQFSGSFRPTAIARKG